MSGAVSALHTYSEYLVNLPCTGDISLSISTLRMTKRQRISTSDASQSTTGNFPRSFWNKV